MFLDDEIFKKTSTTLIDAMSDDAQEIQHRRVSIASKIASLSSTGLSSNKILDTLIQTTNLSKTSIKNMIEEHQFSCDFPHDFYLNLFQIKTLKRIKNLQNISNSSFCEILSSEISTLALINAFNSSPETSTTSHSFNLNSEQNSLFIECKEIAETSMSEKFTKKGDFIYFLLIDFYSNNSHLFETDERES